MTAHDIPESELERHRLAALRAFAVLDTPPESTFDEIVQLARRLLNVPISLVSLIDEERQWFKAKVGLAASETPRQQAFCAHAIKQEGVFEVEDAEKDGRFLNNPLVTGEPNIRFYAGAPLRTRAGEKLGTLCVIDTKPRARLSEHEKQILQSLSGLVMAHLETRRAVASIADYTSIRESVAQKTEEMLRQSQKMEAVGQLTGGIAHDFNNILMVILSNVEELQEDESLAPAQRAMLGRMAASGERAAELTKRLLAFSRKQRLQMQPTHLNDLVGDVKVMLQRTLGEQIQIKAILADGLWIADIDRPQMEAALVNLCVNSRDAMPGGGKLVIETANVLLDHDYARVNAGVAPGQYVRLAVSDAGTGMPPETLEKVFEPFFTTKEVGKGTGLGLSMVYGFIKQSNGHIKIYSEVGHGTIIRMYIPRSNGAVVGNSNDSQDAAPRGSERILLVDDDPQVRAAVRTQLDSLGYAVTEVSSGAEGLALIDRGEAFALVVSDVVMPGMSGPALAAELATRDRSNRMLFISGYSENAAHLYGHLDGNAMLLSKPFRKIDLAHRVREALGEKKREAPAIVEERIGVAS